MVEDHRAGDPLWSLANWIRRLVSQNRRRFTEDGFDLDLAYITDDIIAMGFPGEGSKGLLRNPLQEIVRFLQNRHMNQYKVYNLCKESAYWYSPSKIGGELAMFQFEDHQVPPLQLVEDFCKDASQWLKKDDKHVIAVHCKAGKGRTGIMVCCLLMYMRICKSAQEAIELFARRRTLNNKGVTIPSQLRYIHYIEKKFKQPEQVPDLNAVDLSSIRLSGLPKSMQRRLILALWVRFPGKEKRLIALARVTELGGKAWGCISLSPGGDRLVDDYIHVTSNETDVCFAFETCQENLNLWKVAGDVKIQVFYRAPSSRNSMFFCWMNTRFLPSNCSVYLQQHELDKVRSWVPSGVSLEVNFAPSAHQNDQFNVPCSPSTSVAAFQAEDEMGISSSAMWHRKSGSRNSEDYASETSSLLTLRRGSVPAYAGLGRVRYQRYYSFADTYAPDPPCNIADMWTAKWSKS